MTSIQGQDPDKVENVQEAFKNLEKKVTEFTSNKNYLVRSVTYKQGIKSDTYRKLINSVCIAAGKLVNFLQGNKDTFALAKEIKQLSNTLKGPKTGINTSLASNNLENLIALCDRLKEKYATNSITAELLDLAKDDFQKVKKELSSTPLAPTKPTKPSAKTSTIVAKQEAVKQIETPPQRPFAHAFDQAIKKLASSSIDRNNFKEMKEAYDTASSYLTIFKSKQGAFNQFLQKKQQELQGVEASLATHGVKTAQIVETTTVVQSETVAAKNKNVEFSNRAAQIAEEIDEEDIEADLTKNLEWLEEHPVTFANLKDVEKHLDTAQQAFDKLTRDTMEIDDDMEDIKANLQIRREFLEMMTALEQLNLGPINSTNLEKTKIEYDKAFAKMNVLKKILEEQPEFQEFIETHEKQLNTFGQQIKTFQLPQ